MTVHSRGSEGAGRGGRGRCWEGDGCYRVIGRSHPRRPRVCHDGRHLGQVAELQPVSSQGRRGEMPVALPLIALAQGGPGPEVSQWGHQFPVCGGGFGSLQAPRKFRPCGAVPSLLRPQTFKPRNGSFSSPFTLHPQPWAQPVFPEDQTGPPGTGPSRPKP